ncbi:MAG: phytanoyl-CoA dioxygenase family protein [Pseudomonadota bacterium]
MANVALNADQVRQFEQDGYLVVENAVSPKQLSALQRQTEQWVDESRAHREPFGVPTLDGRPRFDMGKEHCAATPALRRINNPSDISDAYMNVMREARTVDMVSDLIGPNVKFHHCKVNLKLPGSQTEVGYHQDYAYTPHTNDDIVTALLMLDDMTPENGCLKVVPGSHRGPIYSLFRDEQFVGVMDQQVVQAMKASALPIYGEAGSVCLMHTRVVHGSDPNHSSAPRGLYICVYTAADAFPIARNPMPNPNEGQVIRGEKTRVARMAAVEVELPEQPKSASFFTVIGQASKTGDSD